MSAGKYWFLVFLSLVIATLIFFEIRCETQVTYLTSSVSVNEALVSQAQQQNAMLRQLLQKIAFESEHDSALVGLLSKRGIHISITPGGTEVPAPTPATPQPPLPANVAPLQKTPPADSRPPLTP